MITDLQRASLLKRLSAYILDVIVLVVLASGFAWVLSALMHYDTYNTMLEDRYAYYEAEYGVSFNITLEQREAMTGQEQENFLAAEKAL